MSLDIPCFQSYNNGTILYYVCCCHWLLVDLVCALLSLLNSPPEGCPPKLLVCVFKRKFRKAFLGFVHFDSPIYFSVIIYKYVAWGMNHLVKSNVVYILSKHMMEASTSSFSELDFAIWEMNSQLQYQLAFIHAFWLIRWIFKEHRLKTLTS